MNPPKRMRRGFTLVELLVVIAIVAVLLGLLLPAVQKVREASARVRCQNNIKQLALATHTCQNHHGTLPTYNGIFPAEMANASPTSASANTHAVFGSWILHILPFIEQDNLYSQVQREVAQYTNSGSLQTVVTDPDIVYRSATNQTATYKAWTAAGYETITTPTTATNGNGYQIISTTITYNPPKYADPLPPPDIANGWYRRNPDGSFTGPLVGVTTNVISGGYQGVFNPNNRGTIIPSLLCPSDPSATNDPQANTRGRVYTNTASPWASTNYLANWNALSNGNATLGFRAPPQRLEQITDGLSNTVLLAEAYVWCEGRGRTAYIAWHETGGVTYGGVHNFGLTYAVNNQKISVGGAEPVTVTKSLGLPNPGGSPDVTIKFQIKPLPKTFANCPAGRVCCNSLTVQTGHAGMTVALADGSVKSVTERIDAIAWANLMNPRNGNAFDPDW